MPTIIDALIVTLGLDTSGWTAGQRKAVDALRKTEAEAARTAKQLEAQGNLAASFFGKVRNEIVALTAAYLSASAIKSFAERITETDAALGRLSVNTGMSVEDLAAWEGAAQRTGGSAEGMAASISGIARQLEMFKITGESPLIPWLVAAHVNLQRFFADSTSMTERLEMLAQAAKAIGDPAKAQAIFGQIGLDQGTVNLLLGDTDRLIAREKEIWPITRADTDAAQRRRTAWLDLADTFGRTGRVLLTALTPALVRIMGVLQQLVQDYGPQIETVLVRAFEHLADWLEAFDPNELMAFVGNFVLGLDRVSHSADTVAHALEAIFAVWIGRSFLTALGRIAILRGALLGLQGAAVLAGLVLGEQLRTWAEQFDKAHPAFQRLDDRLLGWLYDHTGGLLGRPAPAQTGQPAPAQPDPFGSAVPYPDYQPQSYRPPAGGAGGLFGRLESAFGLPSGLLDATWAAESSRGADLSTSRAGAMGQFQFLPETARQYGVADPNDLGQSATGAARYFRDLLRQFGDTRQAIAAYNWGPGNVGRDVAQWGAAWDRHLPAETAAYLARVMQGVGPAAGQRAASAGGTTTVSIGQVTVHTQANDARGIARDLHAAVREQFAYAAQANYGLA